MSGGGALLSVCEFCPFASLREACCHVSCARQVLPCWWSKSAAPLRAHPRHARSTCTRSRSQGLSASLLAVSEGTIQFVLYQVGRMLALLVLRLRLALDVDAVSASCFVFYTYHVHYSFVRLFVMRCGRASARSRLMLK